MIRVPLAAYLRLLGDYLRPHRRLGLVLALLLILVTTLELGTPQLLRQFVDAATGGVVGGATASALVPLALLYLVAALLIQGFSLVETYVAENLAWSATNQLRNDLALHCLQLDMGFHKERTPGEFIERIDGDVSLLANFFSRFVVQVVGNVILLVGVAAALFFLDVRVGLAFLTFSIVSLLALSSVQGLAAPHWAAAREASAVLFGFLEERLGGMEDLRALAVGPYVVRQLAGHMRVLLRHRVVARTLGAVIENVFVLLTFVLLGMSFVLGAVLYQRGELTIGGVYLMLAYGDVLRRPLEQLNRQLRDLQQASAGIYRIQQLRAQGSALPPGGDKVLPAGPLALDLDHVTFSYADDAAALRDVSLHVPAGTTLGLLGRTGSGKTTVARLCSRLYDPANGAVRLGGIDLRDLAESEIRRRVGVITQDVHLFGATVRDNLTLFNDVVPDARLEAVLVDVGLGPWLARLPNGLDTRLKGSAGLSAGEAQLLALGRVFLQDPGLVILDEATARLDPATEAQLEQALGLLFAGRTVVIVAHRLATVQRVDQIVILEAGAPVEQGQRRALAADPQSRFQQLLLTAAGEVLV